MDWTPLHEPSSWWDSLGLVLKCSQGLETKAEPLKRALQWKITVSLITSTRSRPWCNGDVIDVVVCCSVTEVSHLTLSARLSHKRCGIEKPCEESRRIWLRQTDLVPRWLVTLPLINLAVLKASFCVLNYLGLLHRMAMASPLPHAWQWRFQHAGVSDTNSYIITSNKLSGHCLTQTSPLYLTSSLACCLPVKPFCGSDVEQHHKHMNREHLRAPMLEPRSWSPLKGLPGTTAAIPACCLLR